MASTPEVQDAALRAAGDATRAAGARAYLKSDLVHYGVPGSAPGHARTAAGKVVTGG